MLHMLKAMKSAKSVALIKKDSEVPSYAVTRS